MKRINIKPNDYWHITEIDDKNGMFVRYEEVEQLQALTKELCDEVVDNHTYRQDGDYICKHCFDLVDGVIIIKREHDKDCLVLKAHKYLGSLEGKR